MKQNNLFFYFEKENSTSFFKPYEEVDSLPFPLNAEASKTIAITLYLSIDLLLGCLLRSKVLRYASSLSIKDSPINLFIWYDQVR